MTSIPYPGQPAQIPPVKKEMSVMADSNNVELHSCSSCGYKEIFSFWDTIIKGPLTRNYGTDKNRDRDSESGSTAASSDIETCSNDIENLSVSTDDTPVRRTVAVARPIECDDDYDDDYDDDHYAGDGHCGDDEVSFTYSSFSEDDGDENDEMPLNPIISCHPPIPELTLSNTIHCEDDYDEEELDVNSDTSEESFDPKDFLEEVNDEHEILYVDAANHLSTIMEEFEYDKSSNTLQDNAGILYD